MPRALVVVPNDSYRAADFVAAADALGVELAIASEERPPLRPDDRFVEIDCTDPEASAQAIADLAVRTPVDAVIAADDLGVEIAARAASLLGLRANEPGAAAATLDKAEMRRRLAGGEVPQPSYRLITPDDDLAGVVASFGGPVVIKPPMLSAGRGVLRVDRPQEAPGVADRIRTIVANHGADPNRPLLVERYVDGPEVSVEAMLWNGEVEVLAVFDKPLPMQGPAFEETIFVTPSRLDPTTLVELERVVTAAVRALGLGEGPIHAELRLEENRPVVIELAGRTIGGLCGRALRFGLLGAPLETLVLRHALGMRKESLRREHSASGVLMIPIPRSGVLRSVDGVETVRGLDHVTSVEITAPIGAVVAPPPEGDRYLGFVFARADDPGTVEATLRQAMETIRVQVVTD
ncbi:MAG: ATP-grasp domain-containing protein [Acidimicrobiia bacterium]